MTPAGTYGTQWCLFSHNNCLLTFRATVSLNAGTGSYAGAGYLLATLNTSGTVSNYARWLDLDQAVARTTWSQGGATFNRYNVDILGSELD